MDGKSYQVSSDYKSKIEVGGIYKHFKGNYYKLICIAIHSETKEEYIVYSSLKDDSVYIRPLEMFRETVTREPYGTVPRFRLLDVPRN